MSIDQLAEYDKEFSELSAEEKANERMLASFQIRFWKQRAWRAEQQRDREILAKKEAEAKLERFKGLSQENLEDMLCSLKTKRISEVKAEAEKIMGLLPWLKAIRDEEAIEDLDAKLKFWSNTISYYQEEWRENTD